MRFKAKVIKPPSPLLIEQVEIEAKLRIHSPNDYVLLNRVDDVRILLNSEEKFVKDVYLDCNDSFLKVKIGCFEFAFQLGEIYLQLKYH